MPGRFPRLAARILPIALLASLPAGCDDDTSTTPDTPTGDVELVFHHRVGDDTLQFHPTTYVNAIGNQYSVLTLQYIVSDVTILAGGDDDLSFPDVVHYVDATDEETQTLHFHDVPVGHYHTVQFTFGLSNENNTQSNPHIPNTTDFQNMFWPDVWGGGYHYMKLEGNFVNPADSLNHGFPTHTGRLADSTGVHPHYFTVSLTPHTNVVEGHETVIEVLMDVNQWYTAPHDVDLVTHLGGIMPRTTAQDTLEANAATVFRLGAVTNEGEPDDDHEHDER